VIYSVQQVFAFRVPGAYRDLARGQLDGAAWLLAENSMPAVRFVIPGPYKHTPLDHDHPDAGEAVWFRTSADADDLGIGNGSKHGFREPAPWAHPRS